MNEKNIVFCCLKNSIATSQYYYYALMFSENSIFYTCGLSCRWQAKEKSNSKYPNTQKDKWKNYCILLSLKFGSDP